MGEEIKNRSLCTDGIVRMDKAGQDLGHLCVSGQFLVVHENDKASSRKAPGEGGDMVDCVLVGRKLMSHVAKFKTGCLDGFLMEDPKRSPRGA